MIITMDDSEIRSTQRTTLIIIFLLTCGVLAAYALLLHLVFKKILITPLNQIIQGIHHFGKNDFKEKIRKIKYEDLNQLVIGLNNMAGNIHSNQLEIIENQKKYSSIFDSSFVGILLCDKDGHILEANDTFITMFNANNNRELLKKDSLKELLIGEDNKNLFDSIWKEKSRDETFSFSCKAKRFDSLDLFYIEIAVKPIIMEEHQYLVINMIDITARKEAEERLIRAQKLEAIGTLAGGIAHDFNNILSGIFGYSQLAQINITNPVKVKEYISLSLRGAKRATELVQQILTFSRQTEYRKKPYKINLEVKESLKLLRSTIPSTIEILTNLDSGAMVIADPTRIHQVVMNLCTNAYHAMRKAGGRLTVSLTNVEVSESKRLKNRKIPPGKYVKLEVSDTGHGMDIETLSRAFDPYYTTKKKGEGSGLGLAIVQAIVDEHDGFLEVYSSKGKGTNIFIYLPATSKIAKPEIQKKTMTASFHGNETIMIVDDEKNIRQILKELLESFGYRVDLFQNGLLALESFKKKSTQYDLIITDMTMPGLTGDNLTKAILKIKPDTPIILCTGFSENISEAKAAKLGIKKYIQKPVDTQNLVILIRNILDEQN